MSSTLSIAVAQPRSALDDVSFNVDQHAVAVRAAGARVVVFPELSLTGYSLEAEPVAPDDHRLRPIVRACEETRSIALVGAPTPDPSGTPHISMLLIGVGPPVAAYHKVWLGDEEAAVYRPGPRPGIVEIDGWRLGLAICKDAGVPRHASDTAALGIDLDVAGVCERAANAADVATRAERITANHGVPVAIASFAGPTGGGFDATAGHSAIWGVGGSAVAILDHRPGRAARATVHRPPSVDRAEERP